LSPISVSTKPNPYSESINELRFFDLRIGGHLIPAILDTGAEFNVLNWDASVIPEIRRLKRKLRQDWEIQGANDVFDPAIRISVESMRAGRMVWSENKFIVMNFDHLDLLGASDKPLVIAGADLLGDRGFYMNFQTNEMWLAPDENLDRTDSSGPVGEMKEPGLRVIPGG